MPRDPLLDDVLDGKIPGAQPYEGGRVVQLVPDLLKGENLDDITRELEAAGYEIEISNDVETWRKTS